MQLMREMYKLGEFAAWEAMLPFTKQRLRDAKGLLSKNERRAFWWVISKKYLRAKRLQKQPIPVPIRDTHPTFLSRSAHADGPFVLCTTVSSLDFIFMFLLSCYSYVAYYIVEVVQVHGSTKPPPAINSKAK